VLAPAFLICDEWTFEIKYVFLFLSYLITFEAPGLPFYVKGIGAVLQIRWLWLMPF